MPTFTSILARHNHKPRATHPSTCMLVRRRPQPPSPTSGVAEPLSPPSDLTAPSRSPSAAADKAIPSLPSGTTITYTSSGQSPRRRKAPPSSSRLASIAPPRFNRFHFAGPPPTPSSSNARASHHRRPPLGGPTPSPCSPPPPRTAARRHHFRPTHRIPVSHRAPPSRRGLPSNLPEHHSPPHPEHPSYRLCARPSRRRTTPTPSLFAFTSSGAARVLGHIPPAAGAAEPSPLHLYLYGRRALNPPPSRPTIRTHPSIHHPPSGSRPGAVALRTYRITTPLRTPSIRRTDCAHGLTVVIAPPPRLLYSPSPSPALLGCSATYGQPSVQQSHPPSTFTFTFTGAEPSTLPQAARQSAPTLPSTAPLLAADSNHAELPHDQSQAHLTAVLLPQPVPRGPPPPHLTSSTASFTASIPTAYCTFVTPPLRRPTPAASDINRRPPPSHIRPPSPSNTSIATTRYARLRHHLTIPCRLALPPIVAMC